MNSTGPNWRLFPNLGFDLLAFYPTRVLGADLAGRLFITLTFLLLASGTAALNYVLHRSITAWSLSGFLFLYSEIFLLGLLSYQLGVALFLWLTALWVASRGRGDLARLALFSVLSSALLACHLFAFGLYALTVAGYELGEYFRTRPRDAWRALRRLVLASLQFVAPTLLFFMFSPTSSVVTQAVQSSLWDKLTAWSYVLDLYNPSLQLAVVGVFFAATLALIYTGRLVFAKSMVLPCALVLGTFLLLPFGWASVAAVATRLPLAFAFLFVASVTVSRSAGARFATGLTAALVCLVAAHAAYVCVKWQSFQPIYAGLQGAIDKVPPASRVRLIVAHCDSWHRLLEPPLEHALGHAVVQKGIFMPGLFASSWQQPIAFSSKYQPLARATPPALLQCEDAKARDPFAPDLVDEYDFVVVVNKDAIPFAVPGHFKTEYESGRWTLYRNQRRI